MSRDFQQTHEKLLACAKKHFLEFGFERASIREICKDANVTNGAFYNHFADKEALFGSLVESVVQTIQKIYSESIDKHFDLVKTDELKNLWRLSESTIVRNKVCRLFRRLGTRRCAGDNKTHCRIKSTRCTCQ